jgi:hypothetical protein
MSDGTSYSVMYKAHTSETGRLRGTKPFTVVPPLWRFDMVDVMSLSVLGGATIF